MKANLKDLYLKNELNNLFKKVIKLPDNLKDFILPIEFIPEPMIVNDVLKRLTRQRKSIAVVIDEYGGTSGIITCLLYTSDAADE